MISVFLIRHGLTEGNQAHRYIGRTDEPLCPAGRAMLRERNYPQADWVLCSPMLRCMETAAQIYPHQKPHVVPEFRECDFGDFEGKCFEELEQNPAYRAWVESSCTAPIPNGDIPECFIKRSAQAFSAILHTATEGQRLAFVVHGGTIMAILSRLALPRRGFYEYHVLNGEGYCAEYDGTALHITEKI